MRSLWGFVAILFVGAVVGTEPDADRAKKKLESEYYTVTWGTVKAFEATAELEIGDGSGHGGTLGWLRFLPGKEGVDVLSIQFDKGWKPYDSKWPPDRAPVTVKRARMKADAYVALLRDLAVIDAAKLEPVKGRVSKRSFSDFWVHTRLTANKKTLIDLDWAGYWSTDDEVNFAKPQATVSLVQDVVKGLDLKAHTLTEEERTWASTKFTRDWKAFKDRTFYWWVQERYIETIGVVGDKAALPVLWDILAADPPKGMPREGSDGRCVYYAINAVTRLTKKDVRDKPIEDMDIEKTRRKVLDLIRDAK